MTLPRRALLALALPLIAAAEPALIPVPRNVQWTGKPLTLPRKPRIVLDAGAAADVKTAAAQLAAAITEVTRRKPEIVAGRPRKNAIVMRISSDARLVKEGYRLEVGDTVVIEAPSGAGLFYGAQTLRQLLKPDGTVEGARIEDWPAWGYRGVMLDPARNYMTMEFLKRQIDVLSSYKLNYFHLHLSDSQGWRPEIKAYPNLVSEKHYTQEQLKELVAYAKARFVTLVPELEMPGHIRAFLEKMPHLGHGGILCIGNPQLYHVLDTIWREMAGIFDGPYLHLGGDETNDRLDCPRCRAKWDELRAGPNPPGSLVAWFLERMNGAIKGLGRKTVAWSVDKRHWTGALSKDIVVMTWTSGAVDHARQGYPTINTYVKPLYFDHFHPISAFMEWQPDDAVKDPLPTLMGAEGEAWHDPPVENEQQVLEHLGFYPRLMALAERVWGAPAGPQGFESRLLDHKERFFRAATFPYPPPAFDPCRKKK